MMFHWEYETESGIFRRGKQNTLNNSDETYLPNSGKNETFSVLPYSDYSADTDFSFRFSLFTIARPATFRTPDCRPFSQ